MISSRPRVPAWRRWLTVEQLEDRQLLSGYQPTAVEQLFLEELNDARANPPAYGLATGVDLSTVAPAQPLAFNPELIQAARDHSQDMSSRAYFSHVTPEGLDPGQRISQTGFFWNGWGESLAGGSIYAQPADALSGLIADNGVQDLGHRRHLLSMDPGFQSQNQIGIGIVQATSGPLINYYTIDTASAPGAGPFLTGVVFSDTDGNGKYGIGEGLGGVVITVTGAGSTTTFNSGGYTLAVTPGTYTVTASGGGLTSPLTRTVTIGTSNYRLNFLAGSDAYIRKLYVTVLGRSPSVAEVTSWLPALQAPGGMALVAAAFEHSAEARTDLVRSWYLTYLGRKPLGGEEQGWVRALVNGMSDEDALAGILGSPEFYGHSAVLSTSGTADQRYIGSLYALVLGRTASAAEINSWVQIIPSIGRGNIADAFLHSAEYRGDAVRNYYFSLLHRQAAPTAAEISSWVNTGLALVDIRWRLETSAEFVHS
jgi:uncharacterized protein YkwD